jgi:NAD(P)-dependent dehydrogenase (short-subunit alcohol dehydrogenase family)
MEFAGKVVLITGGGSGIGREAARIFARRGAHVMAVDIDEAGAAATADLVREEGGRAEAARIDVTDPSDAGRMVELTLRHFDRLDLAVNSAGVGGGRSNTAESPLDEFERVIRINLTGVFLSMKYELPPMVEAGGGVIVNLASVAGVIGFPKHSAYSASKHGVIGLTRTAALEYARHGIRVNAVCPAFTRTPMVEAMLQDRPEVGPRLEAAIPAGRFGRAEEIAASIAYVCGDAAAFMNGHSLVLDGGLTAA